MMHSCKIRTWNAIMALQLEFGFTCLDNLDAIVRVAFLRNQRLPIFLISPHPLPERLSCL